MTYLRNLKSTFLLPIAFVFVISSCGKDKAPVTQPPPPPVSDADLTVLPADNGGSQVPVLLSDNVLYGYYVYTPSGYSSNQLDYPLLVFLHGSGEVGNSKTDPNTLKRILTHGPPELISKKNWSPKYPMIVVSPQETGKTFAPDSVNAFIQYILGKYRINTKRIYITGLSMGGISTYFYLSKYGSNGYAAAAVPMSVRFDIHNQPDTAKLVNFPIWTFCGGADPQVDQSIAIVNGINQRKPTLKAKLTIFPGIGHDCWDIVYTGSAMGTESSSYDAFNVSIYDWMFKYAKLP